MKHKLIPLLGVMLAVGAWTTAATVLRAQAGSNDANITMMDNCSDADPGDEQFGGCPEGAPFPGFKSYSGDVSVAEFFALLISPLAPGDVIGHPSWRNEPSYISVRAGRSIRVSNRGGRAHTFTKVNDFGGGFIPLAERTDDVRPRVRSQFRAGSRRGVRGRWPDTNPDPAGARIAQVPMLHPSMDAWGCSRQLVNGLRRRARPAQSLYPP